MAPFRVSPALSANRVLPLPEVLDDIDGTGGHSAHCSLAWVRPTDVKELSGSDPQEHVRVSGDALCVSDGHNREAHLVAAAFRAISTGIALVAEVNVSAGEHALASTGRARQIARICLRRRTESGSPAGISEVVSNVVEHRITHVVVHGHLHGQYTTRVTTLSRAA